MLRNVYMHYNVIYEYYLSYILSLSEIYFDNDMVSNEQIEFQRLKMRILVSMIYALSYE